MGLKDRLLKAKCAAGFHSGEWKQITAGSCDERRDCSHCSEVSTRTEHYLTNWAYAQDEGAPACLQERHCQRCPLIEREVKHTMNWTYVNPIDGPPVESAWDAVSKVLKGRAEKCRQGNICSRCGYTDGKTMIKHTWDTGTELPQEIGRRRKIVYTCDICRTEDIRNML